MARYIHNVSDKLRDEGHVVEHVFAPDMNATSSKSYGYLDRFLTTYRAAQAVQRILASGREYDVVDIHEPIAAFYAWKRSRNRSLPPLIVSVYGLEARSHLARQDYLRNKGIKIDLRTRYSPLSVVWQANYALRHADHITVETTEDVEYLSQQMKIPVSRITRQLGGVTEQYFAGTQTSQSNFLYAGTWIERKGIRELVWAFTDVAATHPNCTLTVMGAGVSNQRVLDDFPSDMHDRVRFATPTVNDIELAAVYHSQSILLLPTSFEGLPLVVIEAAAAGLAIVTTPICGMKDMFRHEENSLIVPVGDEHALARTMRRLLDEPMLGRRLGEAAKETARTYTWEQSAQQYLAACKAAVG